MQWLLDKRGVWPIYECMHVHIVGRACVVAKLCHHTLCLQEWFVQVNQRMLKQRISIMDTAHPKGVAPPQPPDQPLKILMQARYV